MYGASPGRGIRRLMETFVDSLGDEIGEIHEEQEWLRLHDEIMSFASQCQKLQEDQRQLRDELTDRTRRAVRSIWSTACVDLVGSVSAGVALPKSDLDFVVFFKPVKPTDPQPEQTFSAPVNQDGHASFEQSDSNGNGEHTEDFHSETGLVQHFAHAGTLIKLIGGRKKSKLLFRSTKIQVFKDINLIRLRDGCSGISMDVWFPMSSFICMRSQQHTELIASFLNQFPFFYPLSCVIKTWMQQQMLNSGYSGLGSYGRES
jgi:DNA polymerase sigma